jgi:uncharacterized RDD family membrane protein YckC/Tfp pilus assembly major pilin PilA
MYCPKCGTKIHAASQFCASCGTRLSDLGVVPAGEVASEATPPTDAHRAAPAAVATGGAGAAAVNVYAGFWRRLAAYLVDWVVLMVAMVVVGMVLGVMALGDDQSTGVIYLMSFVGSWLYSAIMESSSRQATLGKMALGICVTDLRGERIGFGRATGRYFAKILSSLILGIGYVMAGFTRRRQGLHDMVAGTLVVKKDTSTAVLAAHPEAPPVSGWGVALIVLLVAVVPVTGILAAIAIPAYQDYLIRSQVAEGLNSAAAYKAAVAEAVASGMGWGDITSEALGLESQAASKYLQSIEVSSGVVVVTFGAEANSKIAGGQLLLVPGLSATGEVVWVCGYGAVPDGAELVIDDHEQYTDVEAKYLPAACRS